MLNRPRSVVGRRAAGALVLAGVSALLLSSPAAAGAEKARPLRWGIDTEGGLPYFFKDPHDPTRFIGFEVDLVHALEKELGRRIEVHHCDFSSLLDGLQRGDFDFALNGLEITPERRRRVLFSRPYYIYQLQLAARDGETRFRNLEECVEGCVAGRLRVGTLETTSAERLLKKLGCTPKSFPDQDLPFKELQLGRLDAVLLDLPIALYYADPRERNRYARRLPGLKLVGEPLDRGYYGIAFRKDSKALADQFDRALDRLLKAGELQRIYEKWDLWNPDQERLRLASVADIAAAEGDSWTFGNYFPLLLQGAVVTVEITFASMALAVAVGLLVALARLYGGAVLGRLATGYVEFFRGIPVLLLLYFLYFGLPVISEHYGLPLSLKLSPWAAAILGLGLNYAAYEAEIYRTAIGAIPLGQWEAAASLGMSGPLTFRRIILPQAIRGILPPMTNDFVALFKDTSLVSVIAVVELNKQYQMLTKSGGDFLRIGLVTAVLYLVMSVPLGHLSRYLERRWGLAA
jgi:polar amino acid transport system substrate-binding protein